MAQVKRLGYRAQVERQYRAHVESLGYRGADREARIQGTLCCPGQPPGYQDYTLGDSTKPWVPGLPSGYQDHLSSSRTTPCSTSLLPQGEPSSEGSER